MKQPTLILLSGKRYSGKDTVAIILKGLLEEKNNIVLIKSTARILKNKFCKEKNLDEEKFINDREYREKYREEFSKYVKKYTKEENIKLFIKSIEKEKTDFIIISDLRTKYDLETLKKKFKKVITIRIEVNEKTRKERGYIPNEYDKSSFETELDKEKFDITIKNNGTIEELKITVHNLISKLH